MTPAPSLSGVVIDQTLQLPRSGETEPWLRAGTARLEFLRAPGARRTLATRVQAASPMRVLTPDNGGPGAWAYLSTYGGGLLGGDVTDVEIDVGPEGLAYVSTQSTTKVFRSRDERPTHQALTAHVAPAALLALLPDPVCCFAGAHYEQHQRITLEPGASLVMLDWLTSGRYARGERWSADCLTANEIWVGGWGRGGESGGEETCVLRDRIRLAAGQRHLGMDHFNCLATLILLGPRSQDGAAQIAEQLARAPVHPDLAVQFGLSPLGADKRGLILRAAGSDMESVARLIFPLLTFVAEALGEAPWNRKW